MYMADQLARRCKSRKDSRENVAFS